MDAPGCHDEFKENACSKNLKLFRSLPDTSSRGPLSQCTEGLIHDRLQDRVRSNTNIAYSICYDFDKRFTSKQLKFLLELLMMKQLTRPIMALCLFGLLLSPVAAQQASLKVGDKAPDF